VQVKFAVHVMALLPAVNVEIPPVAATEPAHPPAQPLKLVLPTVPAALAVIVTVVPWSKALGQLTLPTPEIVHPAVIGLLAARPVITSFPATGLTALISFATAVTDDVGGAGQPDAAGSLIHVLVPVTLTLAIAPSAAVNVHEPVNGVTGASSPGAEIRVRLVPGPAPALPVGKMVVIEIVPVQVPEIATPLIGVP